MPAVTVLLAHPALHRSRANAALLDVARSTAGVTVVDLYETYPDFAIDIEAEQRRLLASDAVVFQHPLFWYSCPALLKEWIDLVLAFRFAYGPGGTALRGTSWTQAITTGGRAEAYGADGHNRYTIAEFLRPFERTAALCGMPWREPLVTHGSHHLDDAELAEAGRRYAETLRRLVAGDRNEEGRA